MAKPSEISTLRDAEKFIRMCIYGDPGVGKTPLIATAPKTLILDADNGVESAAVMGSKAERWRIRDWDDLTTAGEYLRHEGFKDFDWVWLDSVTLFQERGLDQIMRQLVAEKPHRKVYAADKGEYGQNMARIKIWFRELVDVPMNIGFTAHAMRTETDEGEVVYMPAVQGKNMPDVLCGYMNIVGFLTVGKVQGKPVRVLRVQKDELHYAKDRFGAVPGGRMVNPSMPKLEALVRGKVGAPGKTPGTSARKVAAKKVAPVKKATRRSS